MHVKWGVADETKVCVGAEGLTDLCKLCKQGLGTFRADGYRPAQTREWQVLSGKVTDCARHVRVCKRVCNARKCVLGFFSADLWRSKLKANRESKRTRRRCHRSPLCAIIVMDHCVNSRRSLLALHIRKWNSRTVCKKGTLCVSVCAKGSRLFPNQRSPAVWEAQKLSHWSSRWLRYQYILYILCIFFSVVETLDQYYKKSTFFHIWKSNPKG